MKRLLIIFGLVSLCVSAVSGADKEQKEKKLAQAIGDLTIPSGIVEVCKDDHGQITVYIGGRGSATASLAKISMVKAEDHCLRIAEASANRAFSEFIQKNVEALLDVKEIITDSSLDVDGIMQKMNSVTENEKLATHLRPEDRAEIMKAVLETIISSIRNSSGVQSVTTLQVRQRATQVIRGMSLFGSHVGPKGDEVVGVEVFKWSPNSASFAAQAEGHNNQKATTPVKGAEKLARGWKEGNAKSKPFISHGDDF